MEHMVSIKSVIGKVIGKLKLSDVSSSITEMADWAVDAELKIGSRNSYARVECELTIENYKACLPTGFISLIALKKGNHILDVTMRDFRQFSKGISIPKEICSKFNAGNLIVSNPGQPNVHQINLIPVFNAGDVLTVSITQDSCGDATINSFTYVVQPGDTLTDVIMGLVNQINGVPGLPYFAGQDNSYFQITAINSLVNLQVTVYTNSGTGQITHQLIARRIQPTQSVQGNCNDNCDITVQEGSENLANKHTALLNDSFLSDAGGTDGLNGFGMQEGSPAVSKFSIDNGFVHFSGIKEGKIGIAYYGIKLDDEGWPMIFSGHVDAVTQYLMWQYDLAGARTGKISLGWLDRTERRWYTLCAQARGDDEMPDPSEMIYLANQWNQLLPLPSHNHF